MDKFICNFKYIFINESCFIKKIVIVLRKSTRSRVLRDGTELRGVLRDEDRAEKFFSS